MNRPVRNVISLLALCGTLSASAGAHPGSKAIKWQTDIKKAQALAARSKLAIMIDFYSDH